jgi:AraC-like DNA-binding protein
VTAFELLHGLEHARHEYNTACVDIAMRIGRTHIGERAGFSDLFVPVASADVVHGVLVCGPILRTRPSAESLREKWQSMAGGLADSNSAEFLRFVRSTLDSHPFEGRSFEMLTRHLESIAAKMAGTSRLTRRFVDGMDGWLALRREVPESGMEIASELIDPDGNANWMASYRVTDRIHEGIERMPNYVVAVAPSGTRSDKLETADLLIRTYDLQRLCAASTSSMPNTIAGKIEGEAAFFLTHVDADRKDRARARLVAFGDRVRKLAEQNMGIDVVCGFSERAVHGGELPIRYDEALWAVLWGLHKGRPLTFYSDAGTREPSTSAGLYRSSRVLYESFAVMQRREAAVAAQHVVKDVLWISSGNLEVMRSHFLEVLWELLSLTERRDVVDRRTSSEWLEGFTVRLRTARTTHEVTHSFTQMVRELLDTVERPGELGRRAKLERARRMVEHARSHTRLDLDTVAASVGMSRSNFARCFRSTYGTTFGEFVLRSRIERSKKLLRGTALKITDVSNEAGWSSPSYFHQAFKRLTKMTPEQYKHRVHIPRS